MSNLEIRVAVIGKPGELKLADSAAEFIGRIVEEAMTQDTAKDVSAVDPRTGEPTYLKKDAEIIQHIDSVIVTSPRAMFDSLIKSLEMIRKERTVQGGEIYMDDSIVTYTDGEEVLACNSK